jgi:hypothetical protein
MAADDRDRFTASSSPNPENAKDTTTDRLADRAFAQLSGTANTMLSGLVVKNSLTGFPTQLGIPIEDS